MGLKGPSLEPVGGEEGRREAVEEEVACHLRQDWGAAENRTQVGVGVETQLTWLFKLRLGLLVGLGSGFRIQVNRDSMDLRCAQSEEKKHVTVKNFTLRVFGGIVK